MTSPISTFGIFQALLTRSVNADTSLDSSAKSAMLTRIRELTKDKLIELDYSNVESTGGNVTVSALTRSIEVALGVVGNNRVIWKPMTVAVPLTVAGTLTALGFFTGNVGASAHAALVAADIGLQYRFGPSDPLWKRFDRNLVLDDEVTTIQFAVDIADQIANLALPTLIVPASQV